MDKKTQYKAFFKQIIKESLFELLRDKETVKVILLAIKGVNSDLEKSDMTDSSAKLKNSLSQPSNSLAESKIANATRTLSKATGLKENFFSDVRVGGKPYSQVLKENIEKGPEEDFDDHLVPLSRDPGDAGVDLSVLSKLFGQK